MARERETPWASVVIPTFNRLPALAQVLDGLDRQEAPDGSAFEVVVVDDGCSDDTWQWLYRQQRSYRLVLHRQDNSGPAAARNRGVAMARGDLILFLGDDTVPQQGWLAAHLEEHRIHGDTGQLAVLGYTSFPPRDDSPFRRWINEMGAQFGYQLIERPREVGFNFFYTSNISLPRRVLDHLGGFREDFPAAAWEDIELSYRATRQGLRLVYQPRARVLHLHRISPATFCRRQRTAAASASIFAGLHPQLAGFLGLHRPPRFRHLQGLAEPLLLWLVTLGEQLQGLIPRRCYQLLLDIAYQRGLDLAMLDLAMLDRAMPAKQTGREKTET